MWYLIVSIPDLCTITYFYSKFNLKLVKKEKRGTLKTWKHINKRWAQHNHCRNGNDAKGFVTRFLDAVACRFLQSRMFQFCHQIRLNRTCTFRVEHFICTHFVSYKEFPAKVEAFLLDLLNEAID